MEFPSGLIIDGASVAALSGATYETINPADESVICTLPQGDVADTEAAILAARRAFDEGPWPRFPAAKRARVLRKLAGLVRANREELAALETLDTGKTAFDSGKVEIPMVANILDYFAGWADKVSGSTLPSEEGVLRMTLREPIGVVGAITPWNFPLLLATWKIAPALALGNTMILKPAQISSLTALRFAELALEAGVPAGVLNVVCGPGRTVGNTIVESPLVDKVAFTGSTAVGIGVQQRAATTCKRVTLELGGKSPNIIFADADLKAAIRGALGGIFYNKGEVCAAGSRLLVQDEIYDQVCELLAQKAPAFTPGEPSGARMGPVVSKAQYDSVLDYIAKGKAEGATCIAGGAAHDIGTGKGFYILPTVFRDVTMDMTIAKEEIFGPVLSVIRFSDEADAVAIANATEFGLAAAVWTRDVGRALRVVRAVRAGTVWVNAYNLYDPSLPFGGFKSSGFGRELGEAALSAYTETKSVWINLA
jgi:aldehyde dehydrogenase (NAD+)